MSNRRRHQIVLIIGNIQPTDLFLLDPPFHAFWTFNDLYKYIIWGYYDECSFFIHVIGAMPVTVMTLHRHVNHNYRLVFSLQNIFLRYQNPIWWLTFQRLWCYMWYTFAKSFCLLGYNLSCFYINYELKITHW